MKQNPWAGLASYQDPAGGSTLLFCGRDNESYDLAALVDDNIFCTLYGKSGTGKTSLLNAGVFPRLREMGYLPLSIRLGMEAMDSTFQQCIVSRLGQVATLQASDTVSLPADDQDEQWLWAWFARTRFVDADGKVRFPVLVFDQFEEVFRGRRAEAETLLRQIHFMMDPSHTLGDDYDYNFRFLASIREDDLYLLEDSLDRNFMGDMKQCRYRLNALTDEGAREVILKPGKGLFSESEQDAIVDTVIGIARSADGSINTNILSLVCSRIYDHYQRSGDESISLDLVKRFVSSNPFEQFYNEVTASLGEKEKQFIEDRLVDAAGRRGSVSEPDFEKNVPNGAHLLEGTGRILQRVASGTEGRSYRIELIHDSFCAPLADQKLKRAARRRRRIFIGGLAGLAIALLGIYAYSVKLSQSLFNTKVEQAKIIAERALMLIDEGDAASAQVLLLKVLTQDYRESRKPRSNTIYLPQLEYALRRAVADGSVIMYGHSKQVNSASFSPDGSLVVTTSNDSTVRIWNAESGTQIKLFKMDKCVLDACFSPDGKKIVSVTDSICSVWSLEMDKALYSIPNVGQTVAYSPNGLSIATMASDHSVTVLKADNGTLIKKIMTPLDSECPRLKFSPDGQYLVYIDTKEKSGDHYTSCVKKYRTSDWGLVRTVEIDYRYACSVAFNKDEMLILTSDRLTGNMIEVRDEYGKIKTIERARTMKNDDVFHPYMDRVRNIEMHPNGELFATSNISGYVGLIWRVPWSSANINKILKVGAGTQYEINPSNGRISGGGESDDFASLQFSPEGTRLLAGCFDGRVRIWKIYKDTSEVMMKRINIVNWGWDDESQEITIDTNTVKISGDTLCLWIDTAIGSVLDSFILFKHNDGELKSKYIANKDSSIVVTALQNGFITIKHLRDIEVVVEIPTFVETNAIITITRMALSRDGSRVLIWNWNNESESGSVNVIDSYTGTILFSQNLPFMEVPKVIGFNSNGNKICIYDDSGFDGAFIILEYPHLKQLIDNGRRIFKDRIESDIKLSSHNENENNIYRRNIIPQ